MPGSLKRMKSRDQCSHSIEHLKNETRKSVWFAFQTLVDPKNEMVHTHTLKVLTASIGNALGIEKSEDLHDQTDVTELDYSSYLSLIESVMFEPLAKASTETMNLSNIDYNDVHTVCWMIFYNHEKGKTIPENVKENMSFKLWMIFNLFAEVEDSKFPKLPITLDPEEANIIFEAILTQTGNTKLLRTATDALGEEPVLFKKYIEIFLVHIHKHVKEGVLKSSVDAVYEQFVFDVLKKGIMSKRGHHVKNWKERWMVLTPTHLKYYVSSHERNLKGTIVFDKSQTVELLSEKGGKHNMFVLNTSSKPYDMNAIDTKTRNEWISDIQTAIDHCDDPNYHHHQEQSKNRRDKRNLLRKEKEEKERQRKEEEEEKERKRKEEEELQRKLDDEFKQRELMNKEMLEQKLKELEDEKRVRAELEAQLKEQGALREEEKLKFYELEASKCELEKLLEEERQAKRDEESVRKLQAKLLEDESIKRAELEKLKKEQEHLLQLERERRVGLEDQWEEKDKILEEARNKLLILESERLEASEKLQKASERLQQAEKERERMQEKVNLWKKPNVGLARPIQPVYRHPVTHRGLGALPREMIKEAEFLQKCREQDKERGMTKEQLDEKYGEISSGGEEEDGTKDLKSPSLKTERDQDRNKCDDNIVVYRIDEKDETKGQTVDDEKDDTKGQTVDDEKDDTKGQTVDDEKDDTKVQTVDDEVNRLVEKDDTKGQTVDDEVHRLDEKEDTKGQTVDDKKDDSKGHTVDNEVMIRNNECLNENVDDKNRERYTKCEDIGSEKITNNCVKSGGNEVDENGLEEGDSDNSQQREISQQVPLNEEAEKEELAIENNGEGTSKEVECLQNCETDYVQSGSSEQKYVGNIEQEENSRESSDIVKTIRSPYENVTFHFDQSQSQKIEIEEEVKNAEENTGEVKEVTVKENDSSKVKTEMEDFKDPSQEEQALHINDDKMDDDQDSKTAPTFSNLEHEEINLKDSSGEKTGDCNSAEDDENLDDYVEMKRVDLL